MPGDPLDRYLAQERARGFEWSSLNNGDCLLFPLGWAEILGRAASVAWRGAYDSEAGARTVLNAFGGAVAAVTDVLGPPRMGSAAARGDVGLIEVDDWHLGMIYLGSLWAVRDGRRGIRYLRREADMVWPVGFA